MKHNKNNQQIEIMTKEEIEKMINNMEISDDSKKDLKLIKRYLERLMLIIERSRIREYMMLTDSKKRLFTINFVSGLGKGFGQAIGFTLLTALVIYQLSKWIDLPIIGEHIANLLDIVDGYRHRLK